MFYAFLNTFLSQKLSQILIWNVTLEATLGLRRISTQTANAKGGGEGPGGLSHVVPFKSLFESAFSECEREAGKKGRVSLIRNNFTSGICLKIHVK